MAAVPGVDEALPHFHDRPDSTTDHLAELFEWASRAHELSVSERDDVGRIPFTGSLPGRFGWTRTVPGRTS